MKFEEGNNAVFALIQSKILQEKIRNPVIKILGVNQCIGCGGCQDSSIHYSYLIDVVNKQEFIEFLENPEYYSLEGTVAGLQVYVSRTAKAQLTRIKAEKLQLMNVDQRLILSVNRF